MVIWLVRLEVIIIIIVCDDEIFDGLENCGGVKKKNCSLENYGEKNRERRKRMIIVVEKKKKCLV